MHYIVFDLEWNQAYCGAAAQPPLPCEIIQIGAVRLDEQMRRLDTFVTSVRPVCYPKLHAQVRALTGLQNSDLCGAPVFQQAYRDFRAWCGNDFLLFSWGPDDPRVLRTNLRYYGLPRDWLPECFDLQLVFNLQTDQPPGQRSLLFAMKFFHIAPRAHMHNALTDALCASLVLDRLDVVKGMRDCAAYALARRARKPRSAGGADILEHVMLEFPSRRLALQSTQISGLRCPACGELLAERASWQKVDSFCYGALVHCARHGTYLFRLRLSAQGNCWRASRLVRKADQKMQEGFLERVRRNRQRARNGEARRRAKRAPDTKSD